MHHGLICTDEHCETLEVHASHAALKPARVHRRPKPMKCTVCVWKGPGSFERECPKCHSELVAVRAPWQYDDPRGLTGSVARAASKAAPKTFAMVCRDVWDDYGPCTERTVHRHLAKLVDRGCILKIDIGEAFDVYLRPGSRLASDIDTLREFDYYGGHNTLNSDLSVWGAPRGPKIKRTWRRNTPPVSLAR